MEVHSSYKENKDVYLLTTYSINLKNTSGRLGSILKLEEEELYNDNMNFIQ